LQQRHNAVARGSRDRFRPKDDATLVWQDGGDTPQADETHGLPVGDDEDERPWRPPGVRDPLDEPEIALRGFDAVADRVP
jgi:hypothetical protein